MPSEKRFADLPPQSRQRLERLLSDHTDDLLNKRVSVVRDRRGNGYPFWRLYIETGSGRRRTRRRAYVGSHGGPELRRTIRRMRTSFWGRYGGPRGCLAEIMRQERQEAREVRRATTRARGAALAQVGRRLHGRAVRSRRDIPSAERYRMEYRAVSHRLLEQATWPGITEAEYVALRRIAAASIRDEVTYTVQMAKAETLVQLGRNQEGCDLAVAAHKQRFGKAE